MRPNTAPKFQDKPLTAEAHRKMILSFEECTSLPERELKCPYCSHYIEGVFADTTGHVRVKCNKCKAEMVLNVKLLSENENEQMIEQLKMLKEIIQDYPKAIGTLHQTVIQK